jgi:hypothetical protein
MRLFGKEQQSEQARRDEALRRKLEGHELTPPSYLWDAIEEKLPENKRRPGTLLYYVLPIAACLVAAVALFTIYSGDINISKDEQIAQKPSVSKHDNPYAETQSFNREPVQRFEQPAITKRIPLRANDKQNTKATEPGKSFTASSSNKTTRKNSNTFTNPTSENFAKENLKKEPGAENPAANDPPVAELKIPFTVSKENAPKEEGNIAAENDTSAKEEKTPEAPEVNKPLVNSAPKNAAGKWMLGLRLSPGMAFRYGTALTKDNQGQPGQMAIQDQSLTNYETPGNAFGIAFLGKYSLDKKLSLVTGLEYNSSSINSQIKLNYYSYYDSFTFTYDTGQYIATSFAGNIQDKNSGGENPEFEPFQEYYYYATYREKIIPVRYYFRVFEIPMELRAEFGKKKIGWFVEGGPRLRLLQSYFVKVYDDRMGTWPKSSLSNVYNTVQIGAHLHSGIQIPLSRITLETGPYFNTMLSALESREQARVRLFQAGISATAWYRF